MAPASRSSGIGGVSGIGTGGGGWGDAPLARALFAYLSSGENQLSFLEGDLIALMGEQKFKIGFYSCYHKRWCDKLHSECVLQASW